MADFRPGAFRLAVHTLGVYTEAGPGHSFTHSLTACS